MVVSFRRCSEGLTSVAWLVIRTDDSRELFSSELRFPDSLLENAALFDQLVSDPARRSVHRLPDCVSGATSAGGGREHQAEQAETVVGAAWRTINSALTGWARGETVTDAKSKDSVDPVAIRGACLEQRDKAEVIARGVDGLAVMINIAAATTSAAK
jgi:hypothetical protein